MGQAYSQSISQRGLWTMSDEKSLKARLLDLRQEHRDLDAAIDALQRDGSPDQLQIQRLKKKRLSLRDEIVRVEDIVYPDIIA